MERRRRAVRQDGDVKGGVEDEVVAGTLPDEHDARHGGMLLDHPYVRCVERASSHPPIPRPGGKTDPRHSLRVVDLIKVRPAASVEGHVDHDVDVTAQEHILYSPPIGAGNEPGD